jgi:hypothetical protein
MRQVKWNGDARYAIWRKPFVRNPHMRAEANAAVVKLFVKPLDTFFEHGALDRQAKVTQPPL